MSGLGRGERQREVVAPGLCHGRPARGLPCCWRSQPGKRTLGARLPSALRDRQEHTAAPQSQKAKWPLMVRPVHSLIPTETRKPQNLLTAITVIAQEGKESVFPTQTQSQLEGKSLILLERTVQHSSRRGGQGPCSSRLSPGGSRDGPAVGPRLLPDHLGKGQETWQEERAARRGRKSEVDMGGDSDTKNREGLGGPPLRAEGHGTPGGRQREAHTRLQGWWVWVQGFLCSREGPTGRQGSRCSAQCQPSFQNAPSPRVLPQAAQLVRCQRPLW